MCLKIVADVSLSDQRFVEFPIPSAANLAASVHVNPVSITDSVQSLCVCDISCICHQEKKTAEHHFITKGGNYSLSAGKEMR